ncbi:hypothetical protein BOC40_35635 [Burkholderia pseudomallei]|nr:hypothetical protein BOC40_35635 [Burkholderia pseudomallei]ARL41958.1 hypothetical protein BOC50_01080 [Burkholderia pseudomallei]
MLIKHNGFNQPESPFVAHLVMPDGGVGYAARRRLSVRRFPLRLLSHHDCRHVCFRNNRHCEHGMRQIERHQ